MSLRPVLLSGYAAKSCARATHNRYDDTVPEQPTEVSDALQNLFDRGNTHEEQVFTDWLATGHEVVDLGHLGDDKRAHITATVAALTAGTAVVLGGRLPDDRAGGRTGKPDALVRADGGGYHPADVKAHKVLSRHGEGALVATLDRPRLADAQICALGLRWDERDLLQLAHYWRMLEACGYAAAEPWGAIIGTEGELGWYDLTEPAYVTFSRSEGKKTRSALERYDHEHDFRVRVARVAQQRTSDSVEPLPLVEPVGQVECLECAWAPVCVDTLPVEDVSRELLGTLSVREYLALAAEGIETVADLADADLDALLESSFADENTHVRGLPRRLGKARTSASLAQAGVVLRLRPGAVFNVPRAEVEIDLDMESDRDGRVYLWGALITSAGVSTYVSFLDMGVHDELSERALAQRCFDWLATQTGSLVYHYSAVERTAARRILGGGLASFAGTSADPTTWVDLHTHVKGSFDSRAGLGLKVLATLGAGFSWRDEDPGGLQSQDWLEEARAGDEAALQRVLDYNEDDVRATIALRSWLDTFP